MIHYPLTDEKAAAKNKSSVSCHHSERCRAGKKLFSKVDTRFSKRVARQNGPLFFNTSMDRFHIFSSFQI